MVSTLEDLEGLKQQWRSQGLQETASMGGEYLREGVRRWLDLERNGCTGCTDCG